MNRAKLIQDTMLEIGAHSTADNALLSPHIFRLFLKMAVYEICTKKLKYSITKRPIKNLSVNTVEY